MIQRNPNDLFNSHAAEAPTPKDAISAFIKSVRLRQSDDAVLWLSYLWQIPKERPRIQRRILLEAGEDNLSVDVTEQISNWFASPQKRSIEAATAEVLRLCHTRNWWGQLDGRQYIYAWRQAETAQTNFKKLNLTQLFEVMHMSIVERNLIPGLAAFNVANGHRDFRAKEMAALLGEWSGQSGNQQAIRLARVYERHAATYWTDSNMSGQVYYSLIYGEFGEQVSPEISTQQVDSALHKATERLKAGISLPTYALDGIHTSGSDRRFAGVLKSMSGACRAFEHYDRLDPNDVWLPSFTEQAGFK